MGNFWSQSYPSAPKLTEKNLPRQNGKVFIVTGGNVGVGYELVKILYRAGGTVYLAARSPEKATAAISTITSENTAGTEAGRLEYLKLDLADLTTIKASAADFAARESRLDVVWNNAGVMVPPQGSTTKQGYELQLGTNCLGPYLFTRELLPILRITAATAPRGSVRICWAGSLAVDLSAPRSGMNLDDLAYARGGTAPYKYAQSKAGNYFLSVEFARRLEREGIMSLTFNPGNLATDLQRHTPKLAQRIMNLMLHDPIYGAYTELYSGLSPDLTLEHTGEYIIPWGRIHDMARPRPDIIPSLRTVAEGGTGKAQEFHDWCEKQCEKY